MDWSSTREEHTDPLITDFSVRPSMASQNAFSPLVNGILSTSSAQPIPTDWPISHAARSSARNEIHYEFSLSAGREFDTDSGNAINTTQHFDDDNASTDLQTNSSEDTSLGVDTASYVQPARPHSSDDVSALLSSKPGDSAAVQRKPAKIAKAAASSMTKDPSKTVLASPPSPIPPVQKPAKTIQKRRNASLKQASKSTSHPGNSSQSLTLGTSAPQNGTPSHTKMCRDRLNSMFERLRCTLPPAPSGVEVKHKAQVLDYAIAVLKSMVDRTAQLEVELAVSSNKATMDWISKLVSGVDSFPDAAEEVMKLFSIRRGWQHSELWTASKQNCKPGVDLEESVILKFCRFVANDPSSNGSPILNQFSKESEQYSFRAKEGVQGRVWSSMRPEWVTGLGDAKNFRRAELARKYGLKVCLAVPVTITGKIEAIMCFYDTKHRTYDVQCVELAMRLAWALGNAIGGKRAKNCDLSTSGSSRI